MIFLLKMLFSKIKLTNVVSKEIRRQVYHRLMKKDWKKLLRLMVIYILEIVMNTQKSEYQINAFHFHGLEYNLDLANKKVLQNFKNLADITKSLF